MYVIHFDGTMHIPYVHKTNTIAFIHSHTHTDIPEQQHLHTDVSCLMLLHDEKPHSRVCVYTFYYRTFTQV